MKDDQALRKAAKDLLTIYGPMTDWMRIGSERFVLWQALKDALDGAPQERAADARDAALEEAATICEAQQNIQYVLGTGGQSAPLRYNPANNTARKCAAAIRCAIQATKPQDRK